MQTDLQKIHLLIAAGESVLQRFLTHLLKDAGYLVSTAKNGVEALFLFNTFLGTEKCINVLLFDLTLPNLNCLDLVKRLGKYTDLPIIILSPQASDVVAQSFPSGMNLHFVETPFLKEEFLTMIHQITGNIKS